MNFVENARRRQAQYPPYYEAPPGSHKRYDQNVNLLGPHPAVRERISLDDAHLYPHRDNRPLLEALARTFGLDPSQYFVANGSDEVLDLVLRLFVEPGRRVVAPAPSYSMYAHLARLCRLAYAPVETDDEFQFSAEGLLGARPDLVLVCNPNNPTGTLVDARVIGELCERFDGPVLLDEAYAEFAGTTALALVHRYSNLIVARTLSKAYGLAGLRIGFGVAQPDVAELLRRAKPPFSVNLASERIALAALADRRPVERAVAAIVRERERLAQGLRSLGFRVWPSQANFVLAAPPLPPSELHVRLKDHGILARLYPHEPRLHNHIRFTVGSADDTRTLLEALGRILGPRPAGEARRA